MIAKILRRLLAQGALLSGAAFYLSTSAFAIDTDELNRRIRNSGGRWRAAKTTVSELTPAEIEARLLPSSREAPRPANASLAAGSSALPTSLDWRSYQGKNYVTPVRNQGQFGSCWAHANTATLESYALRRNAAVDRLTYDLSEQVMVSCAKSGGIEPYDFMRDTGLPLESCYPYVAGPGSCSTACAGWQASTIRVGGWGAVASTVEAIKAALNLYGPIVADLYPDYDFFWYAGGVFSTTNSSPAFGQGHAVSVVGYNDEPGCTGPNCGYFIAKNSWGTGWGEGGFFRIAYSQLNSQIRFGIGAIAFVDACDYTLSSTQASFDFHGGTGSVMAQPNPDLCSWKVGLDFVPWLFIMSGASYESGSATVQYLVNENLEEASRAATITVAGKTLAITQSGRPQHKIFVYWSGSGRGELVLKETWRGKSTYHLCDTLTAPPGAPFCDATVLDGAVITLTARGFPGTGTTFSGYSDAVALPCVNDPSSGECSFTAHDFHYITAGFTNGGGTATPLPTAAATATPVGGTGKLEVLAPAAGAALKAGRTAKIRFRSDTAGIFQVQLIKNRRRVAIIAAAASKKAGIATLSWKVPSSMPSGNDYRISVTKKGCPACSASSKQPFSIVGKGLTLISPAANASLVAGTSVRISWGQGGKICSSLKVQLLRPAGAALTIQPKVKGTAAGDLWWTVPSSLEPGAGYRVKVSCNGSKGQSTSGSLTVVPAAAETPAPTATIPTAPTATATPPLVAALNAISITLRGLGDSQFVTSQGNATLRGLAQADGGIAALECTNTRTGFTTTATGTEEWQAPVALATGDNRITCRVSALSGASAEREFTLIYYPQAVFASPLELSDDVAFIQEALPLVAKIGLRSHVASQSPQVTLVQTDAVGVPTEQAAAFADTGVAPDEVPLDLTYSTGFTLTPAAGGDTCYRAKVSVGGQEYLSETQCVWATTHVSDADLTAAATVGSVARDTFDYLVTAGRSPAEAASSVAATLQSTAGVAEAGSNGINGVWWVTSAGLFGGYSPYVEGQKAAPAPDDEVQSPKGLMISPYIRNLRYHSAVSFGNDDDYYTTRVAIAAAKSCNLFMGDTYRNDSLQGLDEVRVNTFKQLDAYGYIHISSHGNIYYNGLLNKWKDEWGRSLHNTLRAYSAAVGIHSGFRLEQLPDNTWRDKTPYEKDLKAGRMALFPNGKHLEPFLLPGFFRRYLGKLPNSVVVLSSCYSMFNRGLADAFLANGAAAVVGYTMPVRVSYAGRTTVTIAESLIEGKTIKEAYDAAVAKWTDNDGNNPASYIRMTGNSGAVVYQGGVKNGDFETGKLAPWARETGTRAFVLPEFAGVGPVASSFFGYLTTGPGASNSAGILTQPVCVPPAATNLNFSYRYLSQEFTGRAADVFLVTICPLDLESGQILPDCVSTGSTWNQDTFTLDQAGGLLSISSLSSAGDETRMTPAWLSGTVDVSAYRGRLIALSLWAADSGADLLGDTTVLVDDVRTE